MKSYSNLIVTGSLAFDEIMDFRGKFQDHFHPERLHQINVSFVVEKLKRQIGGIAANIAYSSSLSADIDIDVISAVGKDGGQIIEFLQSQGVGVSGIIRNENDFTAVGKVMTDLSDNQIWAFYFGALASSGDLNLSHVNQKSLVVLSPTHEHSFLQVQKYVIKNNIPYVYDPGMALTWITDTDLKEGASHCTYLIGNDYEIAQIEKRFRGPVRAMLPEKSVIITTLGGEGAKYESSDKTISAGVYPNTKIVDPTGAGDAFRGGFFGAVVKGDSVENALKRASAVASFAVETYGTVSHEPSKEQIFDRAREIKIK